MHEDARKRWSHDLLRKFYRLTVDRAGGARLWRYMANDLPPLGDRVSSQTIAV